MNIIEIKNIGYKYEINGVVQKKSHFQTEFFIDGIGLSEMFNFSKSRPWFGQTEFEATYFDIDSLRGFAVPVNQMQNGHFVLYRCHCGCDDCGVIACKIERNNHSVSWNNIYYGDENGPLVAEEGEKIEPDIAVITKTKFEFSIEQYEKAISDYTRV